MRAGAVSIVVSGEESRPLTWSADEEEDAAAASAGGGAVPEIVTSNPVPALTDSFENTLNPCSVPAAANPALAICIVGGLSLIHI